MLHRLAINMASVRLGLADCTGAAAELAGFGCVALLVTTVMACVGTVLGPTATSTGGTWVGGVGLGAVT